MKYTVHLYPKVCVTIREVEAETQQAAIAGVPTARRLLAKLRGKE